MANNVVIIGTQWGDEGKGKIVDLLADKADVVVRFQGGNNAGHTLDIQGKKTVLSLLPMTAPTKAQLHRLLPFWRKNTISKYIKYSLPKK